MAVDEDTLCNQLSPPLRSSPHLNSGVPGTKASKAAQNWER